MKTKLFFRTIFLAFLISAYQDVSAQVYSVQKTDCNVEFVNPANNSIAYSFDLYQGCFYFVNSQQISIADNKRTQQFTLPQVYSFPTLDSFYSQLMNWKTSCINYHK